MSANIPYTSIFDNHHRRESPPTVERGTVLDVLERSFPDVASIVHRSGLQSLYTSNYVTMFIPDRVIVENTMSTFDAVQYCRNITSVRYLDRVALNYYPKFVLKTLATPYDLIIESFPNGSIKVNGSDVISSIQCHNGYIHVVRDNCWTQLLIDCQNLVINPVQTVHAEHDEYLMRKYIDKITTIEQPIIVIVFLNLCCAPDATYAVPPSPANAKGTAAQIPQKSSFTSFDMFYL